MHERDVRESGEFAQLLVAQASPLGEQRLSQDERLVVDRYRSNSVHVAVLEDRVLDLSLDLQLLLQREQMLHVRRHDIAGELHDRTGLVHAETLLDRTLHRVSGRPPDVVQLPNDRHELLANVVDRLQETLQDLLVGLLFVPVQIEARDSRRDARVNLVLRILGDRHTVVDSVDLLHELAVDLLVENADLLIVVLLGAETLQHLHKHLLAEVMVHQTGRAQLDRVVELWVQILQRQIEAALMVVEAQSF